MKFRAATFEFMGVHLQSNLFPTSLAKSTKNQLSLILLAVHHPPLRITPTLFQRHQTNTNFHSQYFATISNRSSSCLISLSFYATREREKKMERNSLKRHRYVAWRSHNFSCAFYRAINLFAQVK